MELLSVKLSPVVNDPLVKVGARQNLHFDVELAPILIARLDVEDAELVVVVLLGIEWVEKLNFGDAMTGRKFQDGFEEKD
jgi:hypothetical protein